LAHVLVGEPDSTSPGHALGCNTELDADLAAIESNRTKMVKWPEIIGLALLTGGTLAAGPAPELLAATSATPDILSNERDGEIYDRVDISRVKPLAGANRDRTKPLPTGNPLWSIPLSVLSATRERPIFSASRRPPQRAVVAPHVDPVAPTPQKTAEPERPPLTLIGAVVGDSDAIAVFLDRTNQKFIRLRRGEAYAGWVLSLLQRREVTLDKAGRTEVLALQHSDGAAGVAKPSDEPGLSGPIGGVDVSYAPFVPRSTPKNGAPDGL
jgi:general secretion pathway protein N